MKKFYLGAIVSTLFIVACGGSPTGPTAAPVPKPEPPVVTDIPAPIPTPEPAPAPVPVPAPTPAPRSAWQAEVGFEHWQLGPDQLPGHFEVSWQGNRLEFANHGADILVQSNLGIFALLPATFPNQRGKITIAFDSEYHATWNWDSPEGQAMGEMTFVKY